jgi:hypothetical protein
MAMSMMPYLPGGLRMEHLVLPPLALLTMIKCLQLTRSVYGPTAISVLALCFSLIAVTLGSLQSEITGAMASPLGMFIRLCVPPLILMTFTFALAHVSCVLTGAARAIVGGGMFAGFCSLSSVFFDITTLLSPWVHIDEESVWSQTMAIGRFTGLFNQPLEAGVFFSVALLAVLYLLKSCPRERIFNGLGLALILIGGLLSLSKNFIVLGQALGLAFAVSIHLLSLRFVLFLCATAGTGLIALIIEINPVYMHSLIDLFEDGNLLMALTAGRLGSSDTEVSQLFAQLWTQGQWVYGRGLGSQLPLDNGYLEYFYQGGVLALCGYVLSLVALALPAVAHAKRTEGKLLLYLLLFVVIASLGGPVITANRANVPLMLLMVACIVTMRRNPLINPCNPSKGRVQCMVS